MWCCDCKRYWTVVCFHSQHRIAPGYGEYTWEMYREWSRQHGFQDPEVTYQSAHGGIQLELFERT